MTLADCSVLVDHLRKRDPGLANLFLMLPIGICGVTRAEAMTGARTPKERIEVVKLIDKFRRQTTPEAIWDEAGDHNAILKSKGLNVPFPDLLLATVGIHHDLEVWARDQHFPLMQKHLPALKLFQEPP